MKDTDKTLVLTNLLSMVEEDEPPIINEYIPENNFPRKSEEIIELGEAFNFDGFQVVRREFFAHMYEPSVTFNSCKFYVNSACLSKFPKSNYVQVLVNQESKILALRPCKESERDSFAWCTVSRGKRKPKQTTCKLFFAKIATLMGWNPNYRYKLLGKLIHANGEYLLAFDLTATEVYQKPIGEGKTVLTTKTPVYPASWQNQFGLPYNEHKQSLQISTFEGYAIYSIKDNGIAEHMTGQAIGSEQYVMGV